MEGGGCLIESFRAKGVAEKPAAEINCARVARFVDVILPFYVFAVVSERCVRGDRGGRK